MARDSTVKKNVTSRKQTFDGMTVGIVVDVNDPQQMGRLRIMCPALGDTEDKQLSDIPWALYVTPFGGTSPCVHRGPERQFSEGPVSYGMWSIPKVGAHAVVFCLDGNPQYRAWMGCVYGPQLTHTMPLGRFLNETSGPVTSTEQPVEPLATNMDDAFGDPSSPEYRTRAAEKQVAAVNQQILSQIISGQADRIEGQTDREGYQLSRARNDLAFTRTGGNFDPQSYCLTTPGLHALIMDDSVDNGRIRLRTTSGNQIILDDTNERVYISTAAGHNWIEMDKSGNIDIYSERRLSVHAIKDINFKTEGSFRVEAGRGIHLNQNSPSDGLRLTSAGSVHMKSGVSTRIQSGSDMHFKAQTNMYTRTVSGSMFTKSQANWVIETGANYELNVSSQYKVKSGSDFCLFSGAPMRLDGPTIDLNSGGNCAENLAPILVEFQGANSSFTVNRVPQHESWGRIMSTNTDNDYLNIFQYNFSTTLELSYTSDSVGRVELGETITRNSDWRR